MASTTRPFAPFEWMIALRYLRPKRKEAFVSVISIISLVGIALGVATLIIVMAVMNGFRHDLLSRMLGLQGDITVQGCYAISRTTMRSRRAFAAFPASPAQRPRSTVR